MKALIRCSSRGPTAPHRFAALREGEELALGNGGDVGTGLSVDPLEVSDDDCPITTAVAVDDVGETGEALLAM